MSGETEWRIKIKVMTTKGEELIDQPLNEYPLQGLPHSLAINVGSQEERQVIKDWHYFDVRIYLKAKVPKEETPFVEP